MMPCSQRRLLRPLRHYTIIYLIFIALLLDYCVIAQENEAELEENVDEPSRDPFRTENGLFVLSQGVFSTLLLWLCDCIETFYRLAHIYMIQSTTLQRRCIQ